MNTSGDGHAECPERGWVDTDYGNFFSSFFEGSWQRDKFILPRCNTYAAQILGEWL